MDIKDGNIGNYHALPSSTREPAILLCFEDGNARLKSVNSDFRQKFSVSDKTPAIEDVTALFHQESQPGFRKYLENIRTGGYLNGRFRIETLSGIREFKLETNCLGEEASKKCYYVEFVDVKKRKERKDRMKSLHKASLDLFRAKNNTDIANILVDLGQEELGFSQVVVRIVNSQGRLRPVSTTDNIDIEDITEHRIEDDFPAAEAFRTGKIVYNNEGSGDIRTGKRPGTVVYIPLGNYGVISARNPCTDDLGDIDIELLQILSNTAIFVMKSLKQEDGAGQEPSTELDLRAKKPDFFATDVVKRVGADCSVENIFPSSANSEVYCLRIDTPDPGEAIEYIRTRDFVKSCKLLESTDSFSRLEIKTQSRTLFSEIMDIGGMVKRADAEPGQLEITIQTSNEVETVKIFESLKQHDWEWELVRKREVDEVDRDLAQAHNALQEKLTEKQMKALRAAYDSGYYSYPRNSTAKEVASSLGISDSTLFQHLQAAHRKLIEEYLDPIVNDSGYSEHRKT